MGTVSEVRGAVAPLVGEQENGNVRLHDSYTDMAKYGQGLRVEIIRGGYDSESNIFHGKRYVTLVNVPGPSTPAPDAPPARLESNAFGNPIVVSVIRPPGMVGPMAGGTFAYSSDSRFGEAVGIYGAVPIHDRFEDAR